MYNSKTPNFRGVYPPRYINGGGGMGFEPQTWDIIKDVIIVWLLLESEIQSYLHKNK